jgi:hypothetical protein
MRKMLNPEFAEMRDGERGLKRYLTSRRIEKAVERITDDGLELTYDRLT